MGNPAMVGQTSIRARNWRCGDFLKRPVFMLEGKPYCPRCGREVRERWYSRPSRNQPEYKRVHVGRFHTQDGC